MLDDPPVAGVVRPVGVAQHGGALRPQLVVGRVFKALPAAALKQHHRKAGLGQHLRHHAAARAGTHNDSVHVLVRVFVRHVAPWMLVHNLSVER